MTPRLNDEQRKLVEDNHNLIYTFMRSHGLEIEEWYDVLAIALCKAAIGFNGTSAFSTYAYKVMLNSVRQAMRDANAQRRNNVYGSVSISEAVVVNRGEIIYTVEDFLASRNNTSQEALGGVWAEWFIERLPLNTLKFLYERMQGFTCREIAVETGVSPARVSHVLKNLCRYCNEERRYSPRRQIRNKDSEEEREIYLKKIKKFLDS